LTQDALLLRLDTERVLTVSALISVFAPRGFDGFLRKVVQLMTGVPTVVYGFVGIFLLVPMVREIFQHGSGMCVLTASLMIAGNAAQVPNSVLESARTLTAHISQIKPDEPTYFSNQLLENRGAFFEIESYSCGEIDRDQVVLSIGRNR
jgi:ABC-type phosphate transport system permease subunit